MNETQMRRDFQRQIDALKRKVATLENENEQLRKTRKDDK